MRCAANSVQLSVIQRLLISGCPVDDAQLLQFYPFRIRTSPAQYRNVKTSVFSLVSGGTGIVIWIHMRAVSPVSFGGFELRKRDGTPLAITWAESCARHNAVCIHNWVNGALPVKPSINDLGLKLVALGKKKLEAGDEFQGYLVGETPECLRPVPGGALVELFLVVKAERDEEYFFPISLAAPMWPEEQQAKRRIARALKKVQEERVLNAITTRLAQEAWSWRRARRQSLRIDT